MRKVFIGFILLISLAGIFVYQYARFYDDKFHLVFCDVGQGDAIFLRTPSGIDILIDGGPNDSILSCLERHMPFWDKTIELAILTHPHEDHLNGFLDVLKNYKVLSFVTLDLKNNTSSFKALLESLKEEKINIRFVYLGDRFIFKDGLSISIVGPSREFLAKTSPRGFIGETNEFANVESLIKYKNFSALLTGDSQASELNEILKQVQDDIGISVLQVPHHGSRFGLTAEILDILNPKAAAISVGKNNKYGHPAQETLKILGDKNIKILRTDQDGEIQITTDGSIFRLDINSKMYHANFKAMN